MNIIKYLFNIKYRKDYTKNIIESFNGNLNEYEKVYKSHRKNSEKINSTKNLKRTA